MMPPPVVWTPNFRSDFINGPSHGFRTSHSQRGDTTQYRITFSSDFDRSPHTRLQYPYPRYARLSATPMLQSSDATTILLIQPKRMSFCNSASGTINSD